MPEVIEQDSARAVFVAAFGRAVRPRKRMTVSEWSDAHRMLSRKGSSEPGRWRTSRVPYMKEIMDCLSEHSHVRKIVLMKCSQSAGTEAALNLIGYTMDHAPAPILLVEPTLEVRDRLIMQRINPLLDETPSLAAIFDNRVSRNATNSKDLKDFPGGVLVLSGANSPASLGSMPIKIVICDEVDRFPWDVGGEGDPLGLIEVRQSTFPRRIMFELSSPTIKEASRIDDDFQAGDRRRYYVPCPHCGEEQYLKWANLHWTLVDASPRDCWYVCEHCGCEIGEHCKPRMLESGRWIAENLNAPHRSYHINALYMSIGLGLSWLELAAEWLSCQDDISKLKRFINTRLGEPWEDRGHDIKPEQLAERAEDYKVRTVPPGCLLLTAGIDTQDDRLSIQVVGWGRGERCWIIDWIEIPGDPGVLLRQAMKKEGPVYEYLSTPLANAWNREMRIQASAIDTGGHYTHEVYAFVRKRSLPRLMAIKGSSTPNRPVLAGRPRHMDINRRGKTIKKGVALWMVGTDTAKHALFNRLQADNGRVADERQVRFSSGLPDDYYMQLISEVFDPERNRWVKRRGRRNEGLDTWCYGFAAAHHPELRVHVMRTRDWDALERILQPDGVSAGEIKNKVVNDDAPEHIRRKSKPRRKRGGFVNNW